MLTRHQISGPTLLLSILGKSAGTVLTGAYQRSIVAIVTDADGPSSPTAHWPLRRAHHHRARPLRLGIVALKSGNFARRSASRRALRRPGTSLGREHCRWRAHGVVASEEGEVLPRCWGSESEVQCARGGPSRRRRGGCYCRWWRGASHCAGKRRAVMRARGGIPTDGGFPKGQVW